MYTILLNSVVYYLFCIYAHLSKTNAQTHFIQTSTMKMATFPLLISHFVFFVRFQLDFRNYGYLVTSENHTTARKKYLYFTA